MFSFNNAKNWAKTEQELENLLENQNYGKLLNVLYTLSKTEQAFEWAKKHEPDNHVPLLYFMISQHIHHHMRYPNQVIGNHFCLP